MSVEFGEWRVELLCPQADGLKNIFSVLFVCFMLLTAPHRLTPLSTLHSQLSEIEVYRVFCILLDKRLSRLDLLAHQHREDLVGGDGVL